ncbi:MAG: anhydro-N-acetylmuramic acid kinase [Bacteroidetes bacterium]|nr:anhydro-N-acetylmuramic acid kinase [Bacteroidota bacterium]
MTKLERIIRKNERLVIGIMSGTSVDSVDAVLVRVRGSGLSASFTQLAFHRHPYPKGYRDFVLRNSLPSTGTVETISTINILSAQFFADAVHALIKKSRLPVSKIDLIGSHGQTIHHLPHPRKLFGKSVRSTLQIGDPSTIAKLTGIITVGNFRTGDMALGGQGAPLVPYFDLLAFRSKNYHRALLNIGGIANITLVKKNATANDIAAFDTGPGNMVIDALMKQWYGKPFDRNGSVAVTGNILPKLLTKLVQHPYFRDPLPKSTGREEFGDTYVRNILHLSHGARKQDVITTVTELTALTVYDQFNRFVRKRLYNEPLHELIISGGGSKNRMLVNALQRYFAPTKILFSSELGVPSDSKEALCFALLANDTISGIPTNIPSVTGAKQRTVLGVIAL